MACLCASLCVTGVLIVGWVAVGLCMVWVAVGLCMLLVGLGSFLGLLVWVACSVLGRLQDSLVPVGVVLLLIGIVLGGSGVGVEVTLGLVMVGGCVQCCVVLGLVLLGCRLA